jgi:hypothetical protein
VPVHLRAEDMRASGGSCRRPCVSGHGETSMNAMDIVGLLLLVFLIAPLVTARPSRY